MLHGIAVLCIVCAAKMLFSRLHKIKGSDFLVGSCVLVCVGENYSNQFIFRNFPTEFHGSHADCLAGDQAPCLRGPGGGMTSATISRWPVTHREHLIGGGWSAEREGIMSYYYIITTSQPDSHHLATHRSQPLPRQLKVSPSDG